MNNTIIKQAVKEDFESISKLIANQNKNPNTEKCYSNDDNMSKKLDESGFAIDDSYNKKVLLKIYLAIGDRKFFDELLKFKEKYSVSKKKFDYLPIAESCPDLIKYFLNEVLTDKQLTRINI